MRRNPISKDHIAQSNNKLQGLAISNGEPRVSHLFFADDSFFFCKANVKDSNTLISILDQYGSLSGQFVNHQKSSISFGSKVYQSDRQHVHQILKILSLGGCGKYLGLPEQFGRKKKCFNISSTKCENVPMVGTTDSSHRLVKKSFSNPLH